MKTILFAVLGAVVGFIVGAFLSPIGALGFEGVTTFLTQFGDYPAMLQDGTLTYPLIGAVVGAVLGFVIAKVTGGKRAA